MASLGTFKTTATGVQLSRRNAGVVLDVSFKELEIWAARNGVDEKKLWTKSYGRACKALRAKMQKVVSRAGGVEGVPKFRDFEDFTKELRRVNDRTAPMGGVLAGGDVIVAYKIGNTQYIGWPDRLAEWAVKFQDGEGGADSEQMFADPARRRALHRRGLRDIPDQYVHNPRRVIPEPFGSYVDRYLAEWASGAFYKDLARQMAKRRAS